MPPNIPLWQQEGVARISEEVSAEQIQSIARELQAIRNQIQTISSQISEYGITVEALGEQDSGKPVRLHLVEQLFAKSARRTKANRNKGRDVQQ